MSLNCEQGGPVPQARSAGGFTAAGDMSGNSTQADGKWQKDAADQNFDYMFKLLIIGNSSVGKTSFLFRYADDSFTSAFVSTVGIDFKVKTVFRNEKRVKLQIWVSLISNNSIPSSYLHHLISLWTSINLIDVSDKSWLYQWYPTLD